MVKAFEVADLKEVDSWYLDRGLDPIPLDQLPEVGVIWPGIACGFLYQTDSKIGFLENYISNKAASTVDRSEAIDMITRALMGIAENRGIKRLFALTSNLSIMGYCKQFEFTDIGTYTMYVKEI